ncbi:MAG TPA: hypothetical protein VGE74_19085 [Gemmata sp.]
MNTNALQTPPDELDKLLSGFFKAQLKNPWPKAPSVAPVTPVVEPSTLATARAADAPRSVPVSVRDGTARARFTLAASVALLLGTGWFLADGFHPGARSGHEAAPGKRGGLFLPASGADGSEHLPLKKLGEDKAKGSGGIKVEIGGIE